MISPFSAGAVSRRAPSGPGSAQRSVAPWAVPMRSRVSGNSGRALPSARFRASPAGWRQQQRVAGGSGLQQWLGHSERQLLEGLCRWTVHTRHLDARGSPVAVDRRLWVGRNAQRHHELAGQCGRCQHHGHVPSGPGRQLRQHCARLLRGRTHGRRTDAGRWRVAHLREHPWLADGRHVERAVSGGRER